MGHEYLRHFIKEQTHKLGHYLISNMIIMTERSVEKSNNANFDDLKVACAILMSVDTKISQAKNMHQRLLLTKVKEKAEITVKEFGERALNRGTKNTRWRRNRRLIFFSSSVDPARAIFNQVYSLN